MFAFTAVLGTQQNLSLFWDKAYSLVVNQVGELMTVATGECFDFFCKCSMTAGSSHTPVFLKLC